MIKLLLYIIILLVQGCCIADKFIPHFSSIKSSEVNVRKGPNVRYPIEWVYKKKGEPVEVIAVFENWNRIRDIDGDEGWVRSSMLSKKRGGVVIGNDKYVPLYKDNNIKSNIIANIVTSKRVIIEKCKQQYCKVKVNQISGWLDRQNLWGVYSNEDFK